ncbi:MAG TPA: HEAT repeat domain-containing protein [Caldithrix abyssi]|uniref:HEAT repeat domain-containing protein n=1 Tax=Caldithrix abyssi TaxID=187145 RepID=A0A7V1LN95_CALAY|nr:HEAT repeat domain-containing protein [Caldithrix abyssi]
MALFETNIERLTEKRNIKGLIKALSNKSIVIQMEAAKALGKLHARESVDALILALTDWNYDLQIAAARALGEIGHNRAIKPLLFAIREKNPQVKQAAIEALAQIGHDSIYPLLEMMKEDDEELTGLITEAIIQIGKPAFNIIKKMISNHDTPHRVLLLKVIYEKKDQEAVDILLDLLNDPEYEVRQSAANFLVKLGSLAVPKLLETAKSPDSDLMTLLNLLAHIGDKRCLSFYFNYVDDTDWRLRKLAARGLEKAGWSPAQDERGVWYHIARQEWNYVVAMGSVAIRPLSRVLEDSNERIRKAALEAMGRIGSSGLEALMRALKDKNNESRLHAAAAMGKLKDVRAVHPLMACLRDKDVRVRRSAVISLGLINHQECVNPLIMALKDEDSYVRKDAIKYLSGLEDPRKKDLFLAMLEDRSQRVINELVVAMKRIKSQLFDDVVLMLENQNPVIKRNAAYALGLFQDTAAVPALLSLLSTQNSAIRKVTCNALGELGDRRAINSLIGSLHDPVEDVCLAASNALARIGKPAIPAILNKMIGRKKNFYAELALKDMGDEAIDALVHLLNHEDINIRKAVVKVLDILEWQPGQDEKSAAYWIAKQDWEKGAEIGELAVQPLIDVLEDTESWNRMEAARQLGKIGDKKAVDSLIKLLDDKYWNVREAAAESLVKLGRSAVEPLINRMLTGNKDTFKIIAGILGEIGDSRARQPLEYVLRDKRPFVREAAALALKKLGALSSDRRCNHCGNALHESFRDGDACPFCNQEVVPAGETAAP